METALLSKWDFSTIIESVPLVSVAASTFKKILSNGYFNMGLCFLEFLGKQKRIIRNHFGEIMFVCAI